MSVYVRYMKMPESCLKCPMQFGGWCYASPPEIDERVAPTVDEAAEQGKPEWCPLVEVPEPHGRGMTLEEVIKVLSTELKCIDRNNGINCDRKCESCDLVMDVEAIREAYSMAISALQVQDAPDTNVGAKIRQVPDTIRSAQLWIPCTPETMPMPNERCILLYSNGKISGGEYDYGNENFIVDFPDKDKSVRVMKWMPDTGEQKEIE